MQHRFGCRPSGFEPRAGTTEQPRRQSRPGEPPGRSTCAIGPGLRRGHMPAGSLVSGRAPRQPFDAAAALPSGKGDRRQRRICVEQGDRHPSVRRTQDCREERLGISAPADHGGEAVIGKSAARQDFAHGERAPGGEAPGTDGLRRTRARSGRVAGDGDLVGQRRRSVGASTSSTRRVRS